MSLLTPERVPVKVYKWDDVGAPQLDKSPNCVATIFKACLAIGYGDKEPAGWTMPFEDTVAGVKVLRPEVGPHTDFYLRLSADTGTEMAAQVYLDMTGTSTGDLKLQCNTAFKYAKSNSTGKWLLIASPRGVWFFCEQRWKPEYDAKKTGAYFFCGDLGSGADQVTRPVYIQHTAGSDNNATYSSILGVSSTEGQSKTSVYYDKGKLLLDDIVSSVDIQNNIDGSTEHTLSDYVNQALIFADKKLLVVPGMYIPTSGRKYNNFDPKSVLIGVSYRPVIVFGTGGRGESNIYISTSEWVY